MEAQYLVHWRPSMTVVNDFTSGVHRAGRVFAKMIVKFESPNDANVADSVGCRSSRAALRGVIERIR